MIQTTRRQTPEESKMARILVIDDSLTVFHSIVNSLSEDHHEVERLDLFVQLPRLIRCAPPDLILLDINMPGLNGVRMGQMIRKYQTQPIPIVIYSSCPEEERQQAVREVGAVTHLPKGCSPTNLRMTVRRVLSARQR